MEWVLCCNGGVIGHSYWVDICCGAIEIRQVFTETYMEGGSFFHILYLFYGVFLVFNFSHPCHRTKYKV